jgi:hypothetical protein
MHYDLVCRALPKVVSIFLDLASGIALQNLAKESGKENEEMRKLSESMHELTKKSMQDAAAVKVLTILTLVYLPTTVVSNFSSTSFVNSEPASGVGAHITMSRDWWIFCCSLNTFDAAYPIHTASLDAHTGL